MLTSRVLADLHLLSPASKSFPTKPQNYASHPIPSLSDWQELWAAWDSVTRGMTPEEELLSKPIKLRNDLIFYLGHIPNFCGMLPGTMHLYRSLTELDIQITKATDGVATEPAAYAAIFERGIDPDVDNPELCHDHSAIPETWPPLSDMIQYQKRVRHRIASLIESDKARSDRKIGRSLWLAFEHEAMHLETYMYMLLQSPKANPPPGIPKPDFEKLQAEAELNSVPNQWFRIPKQEVRMGLHDPENDIGPDRYFGWDNEKPRRKVNVEAFKAQGRPISNGEYANYLRDTHSNTIPASWTINEPSSLLRNGSCRVAETNGSQGSSSDQNLHQGHDWLKNLSVRTVFGPIPWQYARHWPVMASYDELAAYAKWSDGRIPTLEEARSLYSHVEAAKDEDADQVSSSLISAVNG